VQATGDLAAALTAEDALIMAAGCQVPNVALRIVIVDQEARGVGQGR